jgi:leucyl/phenylalanyl-tRNA--protein transferase
LAFLVSDNEIKFPPVHVADPDGLLAIGGDLSPERLLEAYRSGIFPWYDTEPILWWCPDPRFVLFPKELHVSKSMSSLLRKNAFEFTVNKAFEQVISHCKIVPRKGQQGTWITDDVKQAYLLMHWKGYAHSAEVWQDGKLAGGLYGVRLGKVFFGESMFSIQSNASKYAFIKYVEHLTREGIEMIDCQVYTNHLESLGARFIARRLFVHLLQNFVAI